MSFPSRDIAGEIFSTAFASLQQEIDSKTRHELIYRNIKSDAETSASIADRETLIEFPSKQFLEVCALLLERVTTRNDVLYHSQHCGQAIASHCMSLLAFHARVIPSISIQNYLLRILKYCPLANEIFLCVLVILDRLTRYSPSLQRERISTDKGGKVASFGRFPSNIEAYAQSGMPFAIDSYNIHRLLIAGTTVASKFYSDVFYTNSRYARVGGVPVAELNRLEHEFLLLCDFELLISKEELLQYNELLKNFWDLHCAAHSSSTD